tara:strand:+ start:79 stop:300 length:222 start_codon:yes stop_codon:yes gene_type:complete
MVRFNSADYEQWTKFRMVDNSVITKKELEMVSYLHSQYYKHSYYIPCTCSPTKINRWIKDLNIVWDNGIEENS